MIIQKTTLKPFATVVIEHSGELLSEVLRSLNKQSIPRERFEIVLLGKFSENDRALIDQASNQMSIKSVSLKAGNLSSVITSILNLAQGEILIFVDTRSIPSPTLVEAHSNYHLRNHRSLLCLKGKKTWKNEMPLTIFQDSLQYSHHKSEFSIFEEGTILPFEVIGRSNTSIKRKMLAHATRPQGNYETSWGENLEFSYVLWLTGARFSYTHEATTNFINVPLIDDLLEHEEKKGRDLARFLLIYPDATLHLTERLVLDEKTLLTWAKNLKPIIEKRELLMQGIYGASKLLLSEIASSELHEKTVSSNYALESILQLVRELSFIQFARTTIAFRARDWAITH